MRPLILLPVSWRTVRKLAAVLFISALVALVVWVVFGPAIAVLVLAGPVLLSIAVVKALRC